MMVVVFQTLSATAIVLPLCFHTSSIQNQTIVIGKLSFENMEKFRYLGVTVTNTNDICKEIKYRINMGNACYYSLE